MWRFLFVFAIVLGLAGQAQATGSSAVGHDFAIERDTAAVDLEQERDKQCTATRFRRSFSQSTSWERALRYKRQFGHLPRWLRMPQPPLEVRDRIIDHEDPVQQLANQLRFSDETSSSAVLFYGQADSNKLLCVWLVGKEGLIAVSGMPRPTSFTTDKLWSSLDVSAMSRGRLRPGTRSDVDGCPSDSAAVARARSSDQISQTREGLRDITTAVIPKKIRLALLHVKDVDRLIVVPYGELRVFPFAAFIIGESYLIDRFTVVISADPNNLFSSSARFQPLGGTSPNSAGSALVVGDVDLSAEPECWTALPHAAAETDHLSSLFTPQAVMRRTAASYRDVAKRLADRSGDLKFIYFATHGVSNPVNPADESYLALAGRNLRAADLRELKLTSRPIVVMSACETGLGKTFDQGVFGIADAWRFAGASQVIMSLWDVDDYGAAELMKTFVDELASREWRGPDVALSKAMRKMKEKNADPAIWAAFAAFGGAYASTYRYVDPRS